MIRALLASAAILALAGCSTGSLSMASNATPAPGSFGQTQQTTYSNGGVSTTTSQVDPSTGQRVVTGGSFSVGNAPASPAMTNAMLGNWTLSDSYARSCTLSFAITPLGGATGALQASKAGFCSNEFSAISGWMVAGNGVVLTDGSGQLRGQLIADNAGAYVGTVNTMFGPPTVKLSRGGV
ncbi:AprI/Inh family metalloprotease inhibitor [Devosia sp.]|uniref:AprI/Inh family metalloprotease inhibitor n=1 Tax=Devosia sp. TaxID=1871048 RepID=UPI001AC64E93|nr:AprI/Inh family metalloprotease inhibitor [Devosia sp.]MBN9331887.1 AprI/Inh family metalloprotease inhibitor [Devosia sp.]